MSMTVALSNPVLKMIDTSVLRITARTTESAVLIEGRLPDPDGPGTLVARGRTKSVGYRYLVVAYRRPLFYSDEPEVTLVKQSIAVLKRTKDRNVAVREALRHGTNAAVLVRADDGTYQVLARQHYR